MGAIPTPKSIEYARPINWALALLAAILAALFAVRGWLFPILIILLFGAMTAGIATLNLAPQEKYLRSQQARQTAIRTGIFVVVGQILSLLWLIPPLYERFSGNIDTIVTEMGPAILLTFVSGCFTLAFSLMAGRFGDSQSQRISPITLGMESNVETHLHPDWVKERRPIPAAQFSPGANHDFSWYFDGDLKHNVNSLEDIVNFLKGCEYVSDSQLFMRDDFWQHPVTFEQIRKGDCEDSSLWVWRRLKELEYNAELVTGIFLTTGGHHAWVNVVIAGQQFVYETTRKHSHPLIPISEACTIYRPFLAVDQELNTFRFAGADKPKIEKSSSDN